MRKARQALKMLMRMCGQPALVRQWLLRRSATAPFWQKADYDAVERPDYAYGVLNAARQARALRIKRISVYEFGVGGGAGLKVLEQVAERVEAEEGVRIDVFGFDTGKGMPAARDPRDMPFVRTPGQFRLQARKLESELRRAKLVLGDVRETVPRFLYRNYVAPIGFLAIDLDYYSSTVDALKILDATSDFLLPRVFMHLRGIVGDDLETHCEFVGGLAALAEFNRSHAQRKIGKVHGLAHKRIIPAPWNDTIFVAHLMDHPLYSTFIHPRGPLPGHTAVAEPKVVVATSTTAAASAPTGSGAP